MSTKSAEPAKPLPPDIAYPLCDAIRRSPIYTVAGLWCWGCARFSATPAQRCFANAGRFQPALPRRPFRRALWLCLFRSAQGAGQQTFKEQIPKYCTLAKRNTYAKRMREQSEQHGAISRWGQIRSVVSLKSMGTFTQSQSGVIRFISSS